MNSRISRRAYVAWFSRRWKHLELPDVDGRQSCCKKGLRGGYCTFETWFCTGLASDFRIFFAYLIVVVIYIYTPWKFVSRIFLSFNSSGKLWKLIAVSMDWRRASRPRPPLSEAENHRNLSLNMSLSIGTVAPSKRKGTRFFTPRIPSFKQCTF